MGKWVSWALIAIVLWWLLRKGWLALQVGGVELGGSLGYAPYVAPITHPYLVRPADTPWMQFGNYVRRVRGGTYGR